jgi:CBS domain-containing protein
MPRLLTLTAETAADLMTPNALAIDADSTVKDAAAFLTTKGISAAPVTDASGRPIGVLSRTDIVKYDYEKVGGVTDVSEHDDWGRLTTPSGEPLPKGFHVEEVDGTRVRDLMTPTVFSVAPEAPARTVVQAMLALQVHRLFVTDGSGNVVGVISATDVLRHLRG